MLGIFNTLFRYREKKSPDRLGRFPEMVNIEAMPERRYLWTSRVLVILGVLSMCLTMMLAMTIYVLLPQRRTAARLITSNKYFSELENVEPLEKNARVSDLITEQHIEKYIKLRHEIPKSQADLLYRWSPDSEFYWLSSIGVFQDFSSKATYDVVSGFIKQGLVREVEMEWARPVNGNLWQVQFHTINTTPQNPEPLVIVWRAYIRVEYIDVDLDERRGLKENPYGFKVRNYSLAYVGKPSQPRSYLETAKLVRSQLLVNHE